MTLAGKHAIVTGASSGIGRAVAVALAQQGCAVTASGRDGERLARTAAGAAPGKVTPLPGDLTRPDILHDLAAAVPGRSLDILVHCAADLFQDTVEHIDLAAFRQLLEVNLVATVGLLQALTPLLQPGGTVVLLNSTHGVTSPAGASPYSTTKYALRALTDSYRAEINPRSVRVTSIFCGKTATEMQRRIYESRGEGERYREIADDILHPEDIAQAIVAMILLPPTAEITELYIRPNKKT